MKLLTAFYDMEFVGGGGRGLSNCVMGSIMMDKQQQENVG